MILTHIEEREYLNVGRDIMLKENTNLRIFSRHNLNCSLPSPWGLAAGDGRPEVFVEPEVEDGVRHSGRHCNQVTNTKY